MKFAPEFDILELTDGLEDECVAEPEGRVTQVVGLTVESIGPQISVGELAWIEVSDDGAPRLVPAEVMGFRNRHVLLMPVDHLSGIHPGARVIPGGSLTVRAGYGLLGRVVDGLGRPLDGKPLPDVSTAVNIDAPAPDPLVRHRLRDVFLTGVRAIDGLLTCAKGQRVGILSGSGVGKSVLMGSLARNASATVNVIALIGERGREVKEFMEDCLLDGLQKSVVVAVTSDQSPLLRMKGAHTAMAIAEFFREQGEDVLLLMDSATRYAMAQREIGLAIGEPPTTKGYPPSVFGHLARLMERSGASDRGTITAFYTVLVEADDMNDPVADSARSILDGHVVLSREMASRNHYPAIDVLSSVSRVMSQVTSDQHRGSAAKMRELLSLYREAEDLVNVGAYVAGSNPSIDEALSKIASINMFLCQQPTDATFWDDTIHSMEQAVA